MVINIFLILLCIGATTIWYQGVRFQKFLVSIVTVLLLSVLFYFNQGFQAEIFSKYSYEWLTSKYYPVTLDFFSTKETYSLVSLLLVACLLCNLFSLSNRMEWQKLSVSSLAVFSIAALTMLICAQNTIQILVSVCFIDVLGFCIINNIAARRQYIFYNLLADLALFMAFAMLWGDCRINSLVKLMNCPYKHNNVAEGLIVLSAWIKSGLFPFQGYFLRTSILNDSRQNVLSFLSTPIAGFLLIYKTKTLISADSVWMEMLNDAAQLSILWGIIGGIFINRLADKKVYLNQVFYGLVYTFVLQTQFPFKEVGMLFLMHILLNNVMRPTYRYTPAILMISLLVIGAIVIEALLLGDNINIIFYLAAVIVIASSCLFLLYQSVQEENHWVNLLLVAGLSITILYDVKTIPTAFYYWMSGYILLVLFQPYKLLQKVYDYESIQQADIFSKIFYGLFVSPIEFLGRILWLTIDFLIIERTLLSWLAKITNVLSQLFGYLHKSTYKNIIIFTIVGVGIVLYSIWQGK